MESTNLISILTWIMAGPGSVYLANAFISWLVANSAKWNSLNSNLKFFIMLLIAPVLAVVAQLLLNYTAFIEVNIQPWFQIVMVSIIGWLGSQSTYRKILQVDYKRLN